MKERSHHSEPSRGFTLVELIIIITVAGILAVFAIPSSSSGDVDNAARQVMTDLRHAQSMASTTTRTHRFRNTNNHTYQVIDTTTNQPILSPHTNQSYNVDFDTYYDGVTFGGNYQVDFDAAGAPTAGTTSLIVQGGGRTKTIIVTATTGFIYIQ